MNQERKHGFDTRSCTRSRGFTVIELLIVVAIIGSMAGMATFGLQGFMETQRIRTAARSVSDAFMVARGEAMRTGENHIVVFGQGKLANADADIIVARDGSPSTANCNFATTDIVHRINFEDGVRYGTTSTLAALNRAPDDAGLAVDNIDDGSSFTTAAMNASAPAHWLSFEPDGVPRLFTVSGATCGAQGRPGEAGGAIYVSNGDRDYAIVLAPLGTARVVGWSPSAGGWMN